MTKQANHLDNPFFILDQPMKRYAVYYAPPAGSPLSIFGAEWLGWDAEAGEERVPPAVSGLPRPWEEITATPRRYGFHATLKPPFRLSPGLTSTALETAVQLLAVRTAPFEVPALVPVTDHGFVSLRPSAPCEALEHLAGACVEGLDLFRAAAAPDEIAQRRKAGLTARQDDLLFRWGYPYVFDEFAFHLTLTGPLSPEDAAQTAEAISPLLAPHLQAPLAVRELCLFGEPAEGRFRLLGRFPLGG